MPKICYIDTKFRAESRAKITQANTIIEEYAGQGFDLTLRQLYYQFVARGLIPNSQQEYKKLGDIINDGRMAGLIDWDRIVDRTRNVRQNSHWQNPEDILQSAADWFALDKWQDQPYYVEVWIEKDALVGVFEGVCNELDVPFFACRGYPSQSEVWAAGHHRLKPKRRDKQILILHFGDHDPSGIDMTRDIQERLTLFVGRHVEVKRVALNSDQVDQYNPPPNPAKATDARFAGYQELYGDESWELDALEPDVLAQLVRDNIAAVRDSEKWEAVVATQEAGRTNIQAIASRWQEAIEWVSDLE